MLWFTVVAELVPMLLGLAYWDEAWWTFGVAGALAAILAFAVGRLPEARQADEESLRRREAFLAVVIGWLLMVGFTALALYMSGAFASFAGAYFESMSGFTTTGATVITEIESLPESVLFMRSFSHWIGGMGIIVLSVAILPELAVGGMQLIAAEASGLDSDKLAPRIAATAQRLWTLYVAITALETVLLLLGGMSLFDAVNHAMATIATGGFSTKNASVAGFDSLYIDIVITVFMWVSALSFSLQFRAFFGRVPARLWESPEVRLYTYISTTAILLVAANLLWTGVYDHAGTALRYASFQVVSIMSTTGFGTADFGAWPHFSQLLMVALMIIGGCAGSTAGGLKVIRVHVVMQHARMQLRRLIRPRIVQVMHIGDREVPRETMESVLGFFLLYAVAILIGGLAMTALGMDIISGTTAAVSAINSIGPGLGTVGAAQNFGHVPDAGLYLLSFGMLLGRLEIYTVLVLFTRHFWRRG